MSNMLFDNIITLSFNKDICNGTIEIIHNKIELYRGEAFSTKTFKIEKCEEHNIFTIKNIRYEYLNEVCMFDFGKGKLKHFMEYKDNNAILHYSYPVYQWLHEKLNFGWLVKSIR